MNRSFASWWIGLLFAGLSVGPAWAGPSCSTQTLSQEAEVIALVEVRMLTRDQTNPIRVLEILSGDASDLKPDPSWLGACLPGQALLQTWLSKYPQRKSLPMWQESIATGHYTTIVFLKKDKGGKFVPWCGVEAMDSLGWVEHPDHRGWRRGLSEQIQTLGIAQTPLTPQAPLSPASPASPLSPSVPSSVPSLPLLAPSSPTRDGGVP